jgi:hypothetical protein
MTNGKTLLAIHKENTVYFYVLTPLATEIGGHGYNLGKASVDGCSEDYQVLLHGQETSCTCPGHTYGQKCKHVDALQALIRSGKLQAPKTETKREPWCSRCGDEPGRYCSHCSI